MVDLTECLRTYDALQLWRDAEDVLRRDVLREFGKKTIFPGALHASHTLSLPQTPFPIHENASVPGTMRTPYEPFTASASRTNPFGAALAAAPRLDETDDPLAVLYNGILSFVERDVKRIVDIAERISARIGQQADGVDDGVSAKGFEIFANVVWAELARALVDEFGSTLFAAGWPDEFRGNCETTQAFIRSLQYLEACAVRACYPGDGHAPYVPVVRAAVVAAHVLPAAMERYRDVSRRRLVCEQARTGVMLEDIFASNQRVGDDDDDTNSRNRPICDVLNGRSMVDDD